MQCVASVPAGRLGLKGRRARLAALIRLERLERLQPEELQWPGTSPSSRSSSSKEWCGPEARQAEQFTKTNKNKNLLVDFLERLSSEGPRRLSSAPLTFLHQSFHHPALYSDPLAY